MAGRAARVILWAACLFAAAQALPQDADSESARERDDGDELRPDAEACFGVDRVQDISVLSDQHMYVQTIGGNHYLLTMARRCNQLQRSYRTNGVRIQPYGRRVCSNDGSHLVYTWFERESVCPILTVSAVRGRGDANAIAEGDRAPVRTEEAEIPD